MPGPAGRRRCAVCRHCGWYAAVGSFIEIDRAWEGEQEFADQPAGLALAQLPGWAWVAIASAVAVIVQSVVVRCVTPDGSSLRSAWSGAQFLLGVVAFLGCQLAGFVILMREDSTAAVLDVILKPFKIAEVLFRGLPKRFWIVNSGISGLIAALAAVVIIGSVPYHILWSWGVDYRSGQGL